MQKTCNHWYYRGSGRMFAFGPCCSNPSRVRPKIWKLVLIAYLLSTR